ncbi:MAG: hypothetical protein Q9168_006256 [Polycauliona sp. 1 TL-2023]
MKFILLTLSLLCSIISAHFTLEFPPGRDADEEQEATFPCGGGTAVSSTRTAWPLDGGSIQLKMGHVTSAVQVLVALGSDPGKSFNTILVPTLQEEGLGEFCLSGVKIPGNLKAKDGDNATIQCADITFSSSNSSASDSKCSIGQGIKTTAYTGPANANGSVSSDPATTSGAPAPSASGSSEGGSTKGGAAGKLEAGGVLVLAMLAAWTLCL